MITYRPLTEEDLEFFNATRNECREFLHDNREFTLEQTKEWFKSLRPQQKYYLIHNGVQSLGYIRVIEHNTNCWEIGMDLTEKFRGMGIAHTMYNKFMQEQKEPRVWILEVLANNLPAYNLYRKLGFSHSEDEGIKDVERNGRLIPSIPMHRYWNHIG